jgi:hypothetical protein
MKQDFLLTQQLSRDPRKNSIYYPRCSTTETSAVAFPRPDDLEAWTIALVLREPHFEMIYIDTFRGDKHVLERDMEHFFPLWRRKLEKIDAKKGI